MSALPTPMQSLASSLNLVYEYPYRVGFGEYIVGKYTSLEREINLKENVFGYEHIGLGYLESVWYKAQKTECLDCRGKADCRFNGNRVVYTVNREDKQIEWTRQYCAPKAQENSVRVLDRLVRESGIPRRYVGKKLSDFDKTGNAMALTAIGRVMKGGSAILYGGRGCGKTMLAAIVAQGLLRQRKGVVFVTVPTMFEELRRGMTDGTMEERRRRLVEAEFLILDDIGAETTSQWTLEQLFIIVNERYNEQRALLMTSNCAPLEMSERWRRFGDVGERIISRLSEMAVTVEVIGADRRRL